MAADSHAADDFFVFPNIIWRLSIPFFLGLMAVSNESVYELISNHFVFLIFAVNVWKKKKRGKWFVSGTLISLESSPTDYHR